MNTYGRSPLFVALVFLLTLASSRSEPTRFALDPAQSSLTLSGQLSGFNISPQGPGSLTTTYSGSFGADVTASTIKIQAGSLVTAANSGNWQPLPGGVSGFAPANYGGQAVLGIFIGRAALRNIEFEVESPVVDITGGTFQANEIEFRFPEASPAALDFNVGPDVGTTPLAGATTNDVLSAASIATVDGLITLTIPVDYAFELTGERSGQFRFLGQIVAREVKRPVIEDFVITETQLRFTFETEPGKTYTIMGSDDLLDFSIEVDQFTATETQTIRNVTNSPDLGRFFILSGE